MNTALLGHAQIPSSTAVEERAQLSRHEQAVRSLYDLCRLVQHSQQNRKWFTLAVSCDATFITDIRLLIMVFAVQVTPSGLPAEGETKERVTQIEKI
jgi:hypothetical protein